MILLKSIVYRILRIFIVLIVTFIVTESIGSALSISFIDAIIATIYYYYFDKLWPKFERKFEHLFYIIKYWKD